MKSSNYLTKGWFYLETPFLQINLGFQLFNQKPPCFVNLHWGFWVWALPRAAIQFPLSEKHLLCQIKLQLRPRWGFYWDPKKARILIVNGICKWAHNWQWLHRTLHGDKWMRIRRLSSEQFPFLKFQVAVIGVWPTELRILEQITLTFNTEPHHNMSNIISWKARMNETIPLQWEPLLVWRQKCEQHRAQ